MPKKLPRERLGLEPIGTDVTVEEVPGGRTGFYKCPFCKTVRNSEDEMISHRRSGECAEKQKAVRAIKHSPFSMERASVDQLNKEAAPSV